MSFFKLLAVTVILFTQVSTSILAEENAIPPIIPVEKFAALPYMAQYKLSPNGTHYAFITSVEGRKHLIIQELSGDKLVSLPPISTYEIFTFWWATNNRLLVGLSSSSDRRVVGITTEETRLLAIDANLKNVKWIVKSSTILATGSKVKRIKRSPPQVQTNIIDLLPDEPDHILLSVDGDFDGADEIRKINIHTGNYTLLHNGVRGIQDWYTDHNHELRFGTGYNLSEWQATLKMPNGKWKRLNNLEIFERYDFAGFAEKSDSIYVTGPSKHGTIGLYLLNLNTSEITATVFEHEDVDVDGVLRHPRTGNPIGVAYTVDRQQYQYFDPTFKKIQRMVAKAIKSDSVFIQDKVKGKEQYILSSSSDRDPGVYYWFDYKAKKLSFIGPVQDGIEPTSMARVKAVKIPMRDSQEIMGYLTLPSGVAATNLPTVIYPHGGPLGVRDTADWDYSAQMLANRGYAVLQPNFRGSGGYGQTFINKGIKQWGGLMQTDVTDATTWLIEQGIADKNKICIIGASYGGYSALMGVIQEQGLYKCAVSVNGVTNISSLKINDKKFIGGRSWIKNMGLEGQSDETVSPHHQAEKINVPILIMSSKDDARLDYDWSQSFHKRLKRLKKQSTYVLIPNGGHSMNTKESRLIMLTELEKFLKKHIGD